MILYTPPNDYAKIHVCDEQRHPLCRPSRPLKWGAGAATWRITDYLKLIENGNVCEGCRRAVDRMEKNVSTIEWLAAA